MADLQAYQQRVIAEKSALDDNIKKLGSFLNSPESNNAAAAERYWMVAQLKAMRRYSEALAKRIETY